jgi:hypothetical protein
MRKVKIVPLYSSVHQSACFYPKVIDTVRLSFIPLRETQIEHYKCSQNTTQLLYFL